MEQDQAIEHAWCMLKSNPEIKSPIESLVNHCKALSGISFLFIRLKRCLLSKQWHDLVGTWWGAIELCNTDKTGILDNSIVRACNNPPASSSIVDVENKIEAAGLAVLTNLFGNDRMWTNVTAIFKWRNSDFFPNLFFQQPSPGSQKVPFHHAPWHPAFKVETAALPSPNWTTCL